MSQSLVLSFADKFSILISEGDLAYGPTTILGHSPFSQRKVLMSKNGSDICSVQSTSWHSPSRACQPEKVSFSVPLYANILRRLHHSNWSLQRKAIPGVNASVRSNLGQYPSALQKKHVPILVLKCLLTLGVAR